MLAICKAITLIITVTALMMRFLFIFAIAFMIINASHAEPQWQSHESIYEAVKAYVANNIDTTAEYEINIVPLADRFNLPLCAEPFQVSAANLAKAGRVAINVRCNIGRSKWSIFVPATITPFENVVVLLQAVQRGDKLTRTHVALARKDVSQLHTGYLTQPERVVGKVAMRNLPSGSVLADKDLMDAKVIQRGDVVVILSQKAGFEIRMTGIAETDGRRGQRVRVKNQNSERVINAVVVDEGTVSVSQ